MEKPLSAVTTVLGDCPPEELGFCQSHEHLFLDSPWVRETLPDFLLDDPDKTLEELYAYRQAGGHALVDAQPIGAGRNPEALKALSRTSGVQVIASTGFHRMMYYPPDHWVHTWPQEKLAALFQEELTLGMYQDGDSQPPSQRTSIRAGQIKAALEPGPLDALHRKLFSAAAAACLASGAPIMIHVEKDAQPLMLLEYLSARGVPPQRMVFCHMDRATEDLSLHLEVLRQQAVLEYDTIGRPKYHPDDREMDIFLRMAAAGYTGQLLASLDVTRGRLASYGGQPGLTYLLQHFLPMLRQAGFPEEGIQQIFYRNPARVFARQVAGNGIAG